MKIAHLIIHGPSSELKELILKDLKNFFEDYNYFHSSLMPFETAHNPIKEEKNALIETVSQTSLHNIDGVHAFINCVDKDFTDNAHDTIVFHVKDERQASVAAGAIIAKQITWCKSRGIPVEY